MDANPRSLKWMERLSHDIGIGQDQPGQITLTIYTRPQKLNGFVSAIFFD